jgi:hypothetical protein
MPKTVNSIGGGGRGEANKSGWGEEGKGQRRRSLGRRAGSQEYSRVLINERRAVVDLVVDDDEKVLLGVVLGNVLVCVLLGSHCCWMCACATTTLKVYGVIEREELRLDDNQQGIGKGWCKIPGGDDSRKEANGERRRRRRVDCRFEDGIKSRVASYV